MEAFQIPNLRHLRVFREVVRCKSISKASQQVFLSQPAITQALARLEEALGSEMFERRSDGMYPTESGLIWNGRVERCMDCLLTGLKEATRPATKPGSGPNQLMSQMTTTQLKALIAVTEAQNFSIAARRIGVSQSSLHRAARELESLVQVPLFEKTSTGINPTKSALSLSRAAKLAFAELQQGYSEISALQFREVGNIVLGSMPLARTSILPKAIIQFNELHPDIRISVVDAPYDDLLHHLRLGDLDLLIGALRIPAPADDIEQEELLSPSLTLVSRPEHPLSKEKEITVDQLKDHSWVVPRKGTPTRAAFERMFKDARLPLPKRLVETSSQILIRELLRGSDRLTMISSHQIEHELSLGILSRLPLLTANTRRPIGITLRKNWQATPSQSYFLDLLRQAAQDIAPVKSPSTTG